MHSSSKLSDIINKTQCCFAIEKSWNLQHQVKSLQCGWMMLNVYQQDTCFSSSLAIQRKSNWMYKPVAPCWLSTHWLFHRDEAAEQQKRNYRNYGFATVISCSIILPPLRKKNIKNISIIRKTIQFNRFWCLATKPVTLTDVAPAPVTYGTHAMGTFLLRLWRFRATTWPPGKFRSSGGWHIQISTKRVGKMDAHPQKRVQ